MIKHKSFFENLPELISPTQVVERLPFVARKTVYDWISRPYLYDAPANLGVKFGRKVVVRRDVLEAWVQARLANS